MHLPVWLKGMEPLCLRSSQLPQTSRKDTRWYRLRQLAAYKAEVVLVDPGNTTQTCSRCSLIYEKKIGLDVRVYECSNCGLVLDRDHNAALNILRLGSEGTLVKKKTSTCQKSLPKTSKLLL